jgi:molecular chaperone DnaJ
VSLSFLEAAKGCEKDVSFDATVKCSSCNGSGAAKGAKMNKCKPCNGKGQRVQSAGLFAFMQTCDTCEGTGESPSEKCGSCSGHGVRKERREVRVKVRQNLPVVRLAAFHLHTNRSIDRYAR